MEILSIVTSYGTDDVSPQSCLRSVAEAGFSHVQWGYHWNDDFLYSSPEVEQIRKWMAEAGVQMNGVHASSGQEKSWSSPFEYERQAGVELVKNRIQMAHELSTDFIVMHLFGAPDDISHPGRPDKSMDSLFKSLDEIEKFATERGVRIALENGHFKFIEQILPKYSPAYLGMCYDCGHGNFPSARGLISLEKFKDRLICVHIHDNDETDDSHSMPFTGTVDWDRLTRLIGGSSCGKGITMEVKMASTGTDDEREFLKKALEVGKILSGMIDGH